MKIQHTIGLCSLTLLIITMPAGWAAKNKNATENKRWTQPQPPDYGPRWQVPESMQKGSSSGSTGVSGTSSGSQTQQFKKSFDQGQGGGGNFPAPMQMQQITPSSTTTVPTIQAAPSVRGPSLPVQVGPGPAAGPAQRAPGISIPGIAR